MAFALLSYKPEQGTYARGSVLGLMTALAFYGATSLQSFLRWDWARKDLGFTIPVLEISVTPGFLISTLVFVGMVALVRFGVNHQKLADLLIDTEGELRRVTWPSWPDTWHGSVVVVITVVTMLVILAVFDAVLTQIFEGVIFG